MSIKLPRISAIITSVNIKPENHGPNVKVLRADIDLAVIANTNTEILRQLVPENSSIDYVDMFFESDGVTPKKNNVQEIDLTNSYKGSICRFYHEGDNDEDVYVGEFESRKIHNLKLLISNQGVVSLKMQTQVRPDADSDEISRIARMLIKHDVSVEIDKGQPDLFDQQTEGGDDATGAEDED